MKILMTTFIMNTEIDFNNFFIERWSQKEVKTPENQLFFIKKKLSKIVMPKYWGKQIFSLGSFPKVGQKQKTEKEREKK